MTTAEHPSFSTDGMRHLVGPALVVTGCGLASQAISFITQIFIAAIFGAKADMDAFLAANTLPQYVISVLIGSLSFVFIPILANYSKGQENEGRRFANEVITLCVIILGGLVVVCIIFAESLLRLTAPGLSYESLKLAVRIARITWPTIIMLSVSGILTGIYQTRHRFGWPAVVPILGALFNLFLVIILSPPFGIVGLAVAGLSSIVFQMILLIPIIFSRDWRYFPIINLRAPALNQMFCLLMPLLFVSCVTKCTTIVERYLASGLSEGSISHLGYAFRMFFILVVFISTGIATVIFPKMSVSGAIGDIPTFRRNMSVSLRIMWFLVAPATIVGIVLALPLVTALLCHGQFDLNDAVSVAGLLRIYMIAMISACLGGITGRAFYALRDTRTLGVIGSIEAIAYIVYTILLAKKFGVVGIAWGYVIYFSISILWQFFILRYKLGQKGGCTIMSSFARTGLAALLAGLAAWIVVLLVDNAWSQLFFGGIFCLVVYFVVLKVLQSDELNLLWNVMVGNMRLLRRI